MLMNPTMSTLKPQAHLRQQFAALRSQGLRARDAAARLHVSEGEALIAHAASLMPPQEAADSRYDVTVLDADWLGMLRALEAVGRVMALTRNDAVVHEKIGVYRKLSAQGPVGMALGPEIDLRLFFAHWHTGLHVIERQAGQADLHSLQFFDAQGHAVHKVHLRPDSDLAALETLVQRHARPEARPVFSTSEATAPGRRPDADIDALGLAEAWGDMHDTHEFFELLKRFDVDRLQALQLMAGIHTRRAPLSAAEHLLRTAAAQSLPIMVFAGNAGCLQIHTGPVHRVELLGPWLNVLDAGFNLHLRTDAIDECWLVSKPTDDGPVTSIELFDAQGRLICMFFGERKPGKPELPAWRHLAHDLARTGEAAARRQAEAA